MDKIRIIADAMGGDNAPDAIVEGALSAREASDIALTLCGDAEAIRAAARKCGRSLEGVEIIDTPVSVEMDDDPMCVIKSKRDSSMALGLKALKEGRGDAFVSAGSTGALTVGGTFIVKRMKGIRRAGIGALLPTDTKPVLLMDSGANNVCIPQDLVTFATLGSVYMNKIMGVERPAVGIANIGVEPHKGTDLQVEAYKLLQQSGLHFIGNAEVRDIPFGVCDVVVCDGFTGNIFLKTYEGTAKMMSANIKRILKKNPVTLIGALFVKGGFEALGRKLDAKSYGGAPLLGLNAPVIKAHGSADAQTFANTIAQARRMAEQRVVETIRESIQTTGGASDEGNP